MKDDYFFVFLLRLYFLAIIVVMVMGISTAYSRAYTDSPGQVDWEQRNANEFYHHFNIWYRDLMACPQGYGWYDPKVQCHPGRGVNNAKEKLLMREYAKKWLDLRD